MGKSHAPIPGIRPSKGAKSKMRKFRVFGQADLIVFELVICVSATLGCLGRV